ncbi:MAG: ornithine cyclodeaminase family protein [Woeseia sp.]
MITLDLAAIKANLDINAAVRAIEQGYVDYSLGRADVPPVGYLAVPDGECHIKYGHIQGGEFFVIKVATGFYGNTALGLPSSDGLMLVLSAKTGMVEAFLQDEGHLTNMRTAMGGMIAAKYLAPSEVTGIGIVGAGVQAELQLRLLKNITQCRRVTIWNRNKERAEALAATVVRDGFDVEISDSVEGLVRASNLIVTTTPAQEPLIAVDWVAPGTHITAVGADTPGKQELATALIANADIVVVDSIAQCTDHGEIQTAFRDGRITKESLRELGNVINEPNLRRQNDQQISIADLTGVAVQDIQIASAVFSAWKSKNG